MKKIVIPGEIVSAERKRLGGNVFVYNGKIYSKVLGLYDDEGDLANVIAFNGVYYPKKEDVIIGTVSKVVPVGYTIDINSFVDSFIPEKSLQEDLKVGDIISAKIQDVDEMKEADLVFPRKLIGGEILEVTPSKVPRFIGKNASMYELIKKGTNCNLLIGKNGRIWARGGNISLLKKVIQFIEENFYKNNLTNAVEELLKRENPAFKGLTVSSVSNMNEPNYDRNGFEENFVEGEFDE